MIQYPLKFFVKTEAQSGIESSWISHSAENRVSPCAIPPEFAGPGGGYSPEDFFALALLNCYVATFKVFAKNSKAEYESIHCEGNLVVDKEENGHPWMKNFHLKVLIKGTKDKERMQRLAEKVGKSCLVHNSVKTQIESTFEIS